MATQLPSPRAIPSREAALRNMLEYNAHLQTQDCAGVRRLISDVRTWYALATESGYQFGPSMYIGFDQMTPHYYVEGVKASSRVLRSDTSNRNLASWTELLNEADARFPGINEALDTFCGTHSEKLNVRAKIYIFR